VRRPRLRLIPLCLAVSGALHAQTEPATVAANQWQLCRAPGTLPMFQPGPPPEGDRERTPTDISADQLNLKQATQTEFEGKVQLRRLDQWLGTEKLTYSHDQERFVTEGPVRYQDRNLRLTAEQVRGDERAGSMELDNITYQFNDQAGNGKADEAVMKGDQSKLSGATYSTCPPGQRQWEFSASQISINQDTHTGVATNATLKIGRIPVLWLPVISFPTDDKRRSGVLAPSIGRDDRNGLDLKLPIYLNLAPNYDATLTPRWLSKRGLMLEGEFRYLGRRSSGTFEGTYLHDDDITRRDRSYLSLEHNTALSRFWYAHASLQRVSDPLYFSDFGDSIANTTISLLPSEVGLYGRGRYWTASLTASDWQIANPLITADGVPYRRLPRLQASAHKPLLPWLDAGLSLEAVHFQHQSLGGGQRLDIEPTLRMPLGGGAWFLTPQLAWRYTRYSLDDRLAGPDNDRTKTRSLPLFSLDAGANFERQTRWGGHDLIQTLEPRLFYLRVPYRNQDDLPLFDTRELTFSWNSLFRDNRFGGADRQADANQLTLAVTSRFLGAEDGRERLALSLGRISYFDPPQVTLPDALPLSRDGSDWVAEAKWSVSDRWDVALTQQWDPDHSQTDLTSVRSQYRWSNGGLLNLAYRYRRDVLEQSDLSFVLPVKDKWNLYGRWNYSLRDRQTLEALGGVEWRSCCMAVRFVGRQYIRSFNSRQNIGVYLEIELNGLGSFGRDTGRLLENAILGYYR